MMHDTTASLYFDLIDPLSYLLQLELAQLPGESAEEIVFCPFELRPPPTPLVVIDAEELAPRWASARELAAAAGVSLSPPRLVPWSRKGHELCLFAETHGLARPIRAAIQEAYFLHGQDIGRVDVLVDIARGSGLDATETKAVLDVDRFDAAVAESRREAEAIGVTSSPTLVLGASRLEGFHNRSTLSTFLRPS